MSQVQKNKGNGVKTRHIYQHNIYLKEMTYPTAGMSYHGHHHDFDHVTMIASGGVRVVFGAIPEMGIPEETREYRAVDMFVTRSFREHTITSLEPNTVVCCVHAIRNEEGEIINLAAREGHEHDPDEKFQSWNDAAQAVGNLRRGRLAFTANVKELDEMYKRAEEEGVLVPGSGDMLV